MKAFNGYKYCPHCENIYPILMFGKGSGIDGFSTYCKECEAEYSMIRRKKLKEKGICIACGKNKINYMRSFCKCDICLFKHNVYENSRRRKLLLNGLCRECGKRPLYTYYRCFECNSRESLLRKKRKCSTNIEEELRLINEYLATQV